MTTSPTTRGEPAKPHPGVSTCASAAASRDHTTAPLPASSAFKRPVPPNEYTRPSRIAGVARGPGPPSESQCRIGSPCRHTGSPVWSL